MATKKSHFSSVNMYITRQKDENKVSGEKKKAKGIYVSVSVYRNHATART